MNSQEVFPGRGGVLGVEGCRGILNISPAAGLRVSKGPSLGEGGS